jgi:hypothetical protein
VVNLSIDQFVALEVWVERLAKADTGLRVHAARQRAFALLTGIDAPLSAQGEETLAFADAVVEGVSALRRIGPKVKAVVLDDEDLA